MTTPSDNARSDLAKGALRSQIQRRELQIERVESPRVAAEETLQPSSRRRSKSGRRTTMPSRGRSKYDIVLGEAQISQRSNDEAIWHVGRRPMSAT
jgi:hypothetical protein